MPKITATNMFIISLLKDEFKNPLASYEIHKANLDFQTDTQHWSFILIKALELNSNLRPLAKRLILDNKVQICELLVNATALSFIGLQTKKAPMENVLNGMNEFLSNTDIKLHFQNEKVSEIEDYQKTIFSLLSDNQKKNLENYLIGVNLQKFTTQILNHQLKKAA